MTAKTLDAEALAASVRAALRDAGPVREVKMFGGIGFMLNGNLIAGASKRGLLLRVGEDRAAAALEKPGARPLIMRGRYMKDYVYIDPPGLSPRSVRPLIKMALSFVMTLPPKSKAKSPRKGKR
jgi:TfoX/Sxy family transcriptional regulator of competence genes